MKLEIKENVFDCKVCINEKSIMNGMKKKRFNDSFNGMFFIMPSKMEQSFSMYDCLIPLDIIMIENKTITKINHNCRPCDDLTACKVHEGFGNYVLEVSGGTCKHLNINEGDMVLFKI